MIKFEVGDRISAYNYPNYYKGIVVSIVNCDLEIKFIKKNGIPYTCKDKEFFYKKQCRLLYKYGVAKVGDEVIYKGNRYTVDIKRPDENIYRLLDNILCVGSVFSVYQEKLKIIQKNTKPATSGLVIKKIGDREMSCSSKGGGTISQCFNPKCNGIARIDSNGNWKCDTCSFESGLGDGSEEIHKEKPIFDYSGIELHSHEDYWLQVINGLAEKFDARIKKLESLYKVKHANEIYFKEINARLNFLENK